VPRADSPVPSKAASFSGAEGDAHPVASRTRSRANSTAPSVAASFSTTDDGTLGTRPSTNLSFDPDKDMLKQEREVRRFQKIVKEHKPDHVEDPARCWCKTRHGKACRSFRMQAGLYCHAHWRQDPRAYEAFFKELCDQVQQQGDLE
jgi:hypothetical protein